MKDKRKQRIRDNKREREKETLKYRNLTVNYFFQPVAFKTFGEIGTLTAKFLSTLVARLTEVSGNIRKGAWLSQCPSLATACGNAASMLTYFRRFC